MLFGRRWLQKIILHAQSSVKDVELKLYYGVTIHQVSVVVISFAFKFANMEQVLEIGG